MTIFALYMLSQFVLTKTFQCPKKTKDFFYQAGSAMPDPDMYFSANIAG